MNLNVSNTLNQGISAQNNGQFQEAARLYRIVLSSEPNNSDAYYNLGIISLVYSKIDEALINFKNAITNNPKIEQFWISYIQTLIKNNELEKAKLWDDLENSDKNIFAGMYQFWCQKV